MDMFQNKDAIFDEKRLKFLKFVNLFFYWNGRNLERRLKLGDSINNKKESIFKWVL